MRKKIVGLLSVLIFSSCSTPADLFDAVWPIQVEANTLKLKLMAVKTEPEFVEYQKKLTKLKDEINKYKDREPADSLCFYIKREIDYLDQFAKDNGNGLLSRSGGVLQQLTKETSDIEKKIEEKTRCFLSKYDLNTDFYQLLSK